MTPQEQQLIDGLVNRIQSTPAAEKDNDADAYLHQHLDGVPDALYVLAQTVLVQQYGLNNAQQQLQAAQQQVDDLQRQLDQARSQAQPSQQKSGSFLSHLFGGDDARPSTPQQQYQPVNTGYAPSSPYGQPTYAPPSGYGQPVLVQPVQVAPMGYGYGGGGGFLRGALQTAAGVAAGEMMFQGMEDLFRGFGGEHRGYEGGYDRPGEVINNNYYGDEPAHEHHEANTDASGSGDSSFYNAANDASRQDLSPDIEDRRGLESNDSGYDANSSAGDAQDFDDAGSSDDNSGYDDGGSYDDSNMGGDDGGGF